MDHRTQISAEIQKSLQDFAITYFFVYKIQIENAELVSKNLLTIKPNNGLLSELGYGYINGSVTEYVLSLYDAVMLLKKAIREYEYKPNEPIDLIFKFRRHVLAHRGCNWGSAESNETLKFLAEGNIFKTCHEAANEFVQDLRKYMNFSPLKQFPRIQKIMKHDLDNLFNKAPELAYYYSISNLDEVKKFFGTDLLPESKE